MRLGEAKTPEGMRLYAIGDVHGCDDMLADMHRRIAEDLVARPVPDHRVVHLGDYVDRGRRCAAVIDRLARLTAADPRVVCLLGNHDEMMLGFLDDPLRYGPVWLDNGGTATLASYGVSARGWYHTRDELLALAEGLAAGLPAAHRTFLDGLDRVARFGDYFFCHAGIRPGVPLDEQSAYDLIWIREEFLTDASDHGVVVVHGHTPARRPEVRTNRINIDTGAVYGGSLTLLALDGTGYRFL